MRKVHRCRYRADELTTIIDTFIRSEYILPAESSGNFYFSLGADDSTLPDVAKRIGTKRLMIGSDYPSRRDFPQYGKCSTPERV